MWGVATRTLTQPMRECQLDLSRQHNHAAVGLFPDRLRSYFAVFTQGKVDPTPLESRHRFELEHLAGRHHPLGGSVRQVAMH